ncbi:hypothetical protein ACMFMF_002632 [Clarireedia jacksonii]
MSSIAKKMESSSSEMFDSTDMTGSWVAALNSGKLTSEYLPEKEPYEVKRRLQQLDSSESENFEDIHLAGVEGLGIHVTIDRKKERNPAGKMDMSRQNKGKQKATEVDTDNLDDLDKPDNFEDIEEQEKVMGEPLDMGDTDTACYGSISPPPSSFGDSDSPSQDHSYLIPPPATPIRKNTTSLYPLSSRARLETFAPVIFSGFGDPVRDTLRINGRKVHMSESALTRGERALYNEQSMYRFRTRWNSPLRKCWIPSDDFDAREENTLVGVVDYGADTSSSEEFVSIACDGATIDELEVFL